MRVQMDLCAQHNSGSANLSSAFSGARFEWISVGVEARCPLRRYARLVGAPNYAPSLRSVAGLLHALTLQSAFGDTPPLLHRFVTAPRPRLLRASGACNRRAVRDPRVSECSPSSGDDWRAPARE